MMVGEQDGRGAFVELRGYLYRREIEPTKHVQRSATLPVTNELLSLFTVNHPRSACLIWSRVVVVYLYDCGQPQRVGHVHC